MTAIKSRHSKCTSLLLHLFLIIHKGPMTSYETNITGILLKRRNVDLLLWCAIMTTPHMYGKQKVMNDPTKSINLPEHFSTALARRITRGSLVPATSTLYGVAVSISVVSVEGGTL